MNLYQFNLLEEAEQSDLIDNKAVLIAERIEGDYTFALYRLETFYIEQKYYTGFEECLSYTAFDSDKRPTQYQDNIDLYYSGRGDR